MSLSRAFGALFVVATMAGGLAGCGDDNTKNMVSAPGSTGVGAPGAETARPTSNEEYQKKFGSMKGPMTDQKNYPK